MIILFRYSNYFFIIPSYPPYRFIHKIVVHLLQGKASISNDTSSFDDGGSASSLNGSDLAILTFSQETVTGYLCSLISC